MARTGLVALTALLASASAVSAATCDTSALNTTLTQYQVTVAGTTVADIAAATNRGLCNVARINFMADESIVPNVGQTLTIPGEVCPDEVDNTSCVVDNYNSTNQCLLGGPRLYYTVTGDTYAKIANRLDLAVTALTTGNASAVLSAGQFVKVPLCLESFCSYRPFQFNVSEYKTYKDLADENNSTVGQFMMLSPTYNYSSAAFEAKTPPTVGLPYNCVATSDSLTVIT